VRELASRVWLWLESRRLQRPFTRAQDYCEDDGNKFPETNPWRNRLLNMKVVGPAALFTSRGARHPRERALTGLCELLWLEAEKDDRFPISRRRIEAYKKLWKQVR
jgi:hypothetical protein